MPRIEIASEAGACFGVERALGMVEELALVGTQSVCTLGALIHNPRVVESLEEKGVRKVTSPADAAGCALVLRTHGSTPAEEAIAHETAEVVVDATCPFVTRVHREVERMAAAGRRIVVVGEQGHPEVEATLARAEGSVCIICPEEAARFEGSAKLGVVAQTTLNHEVFEACCNALAKLCDDIEVVNTICDATSRRQEAARELARRADCMIVIGGMNSANTRHLADICSESCANTHHVESPEEFVPAWFEDADLIGITAGASTPDAYIEEAVAAIRELTGAESA